MGQELKPPGMVVARVVRISEKGKIWIKRRFPTSGEFTMQGYIDMKIHINDQIRGDKGTFYGLEFFTGGQKHFAHDREFEVTGQNTIEEINMSLSRMIEKACTSPERADSIQIHSGIMSIKG